MAQVLSAVDIGSNTVHILVAEVDNGTICKLADENEWISLGEIVSREGMIPRAVQDRLIKTIDSFKRIAAAKQSDGIYVFATEAMRKASNSDSVLKSILQATGIKVELIDGQREAEIGLRGAITDSEGPEPFLMVEIGGGSAQLAHSTKKGILSESSLPLGTGRMLAEINIDFPTSPPALDRLIHTVGDALDTCPAWDDVQHLIASGGVARGLWRALHPDGDRVLAYEELDFLIWATQRLSLEQITDRFNVKAKRAATILPGAVVYKMVMQRVELAEMTVSRFGVREGAVLEMADGRIVPCPL